MVLTASPDTPIDEQHRDRARVVASEMARGNAWLIKVAELAYLLVVDSMQRDGTWRKTVPWLADMVLFGQAQIEDAELAAAAAAVSTLAMVEALYDLVPNDAARATAAFLAQTERRVELALSA